MWLGIELKTRWGDIRGSIDIYSKNIFQSYNVYANKDDGFK